MVSQETKGVLYAIAVALALIGVCVIGTASVRCKESSQRMMNDRANFVAKCKSVGGEIGGDKCYVNGTEVFSE